MIQDECKTLAEWFFKQKVVKFGDGYIQLANNTKVTFLPDTDSNLLDALEERMFEMANFDCIIINFSKNAKDEDSRVRCSYYKYKTNIGTTYAMSALGRNQKDARIKGLLKYIKKGTMI